MSDRLMAFWQIKGKKSMKKRLLVVVDYQKDFVDGALGFNGAETLEKPILNRIEDYLVTGDEVIYTLDTHLKNYLETTEGKHLPIEHCILETEGHGLYGGLKEALKEKKSFLKYTFGSMALGRYLEENHFEEIEFCGLVSNICVLSNMVIAKAASPESTIFVNRKLTGSFDETMQEKAFDILKNLHMQVI